MALGGGSVGDASISFKVRVDELQRDLRAARDTTEDAAQKMANSLKRVELQTARLALQQRKLALETARVAAAEDRLAKSLDNVGRSVQRSSVGIQALSRQFLVLRAATSALPAALGISAVVKAADAYQLLSARLKVVARDGEDTSATFNALFNIAQETRTPLEDISDLYLRLTQTTGSLGLSQNQVISLIDQINKLLRISGVNAIEASGGLVQLTQGFSRLSVEGQEFRTLSLQLGEILRTVAKAEGVDISKLIDEGSISAIRIIRGLGKQADDTNERFRNLPVTVEGALVRIRNAFIATVGASTNANSAFRDVVNSLLEIEKTLGGEGFKAGFGGLVGFLATAFETTVKLTAKLGELSTELARLGAAAETAGFPSLPYLSRTETALRLLELVRVAVGNVATAFEDLNAVSASGLPPDTLKALRQAGVTFEEVSAIIKDDRKAILDLGDAGTKSSDGLDKLNNSGKDQAEILERVKEAQLEYRKSLQDTIDVLAEQGAQAFEEYQQRQEDAVQSAEEAAERLKTLAGAINELKNELALEGIPEDYRQLNSILQGLEINVIATADGVRAIGDATEEELQTAEALLVIWNNILKARQQAALVTTVDVRANEEANLRLAQQRAQERKDETEATAGTEDQARIESASRLPDSIDVANVASQELASTLTDINNLSFDTLLESFANIAQAISEMIVRALLFQAINAGIGAVFPGSASGQAAAAAPPAPARHGMVIKRMRGGGFITDRPTIIPMADGRAALTSEYGQQEAVLPLKRMASGDMGVAFDGPPGGGAGNVINIDARQSTPGTVSAAVQAAVRLAPNAVVNAQSRRQIGRGKAPF